MMHGPRIRPSGSSENAQAMRRAFVKHVHQLIRSGYERLRPSDHVKEEEPAITGLLVQAIHDELSECSHAWMRLFNVHDDPPVNDGHRRGKKRRRVDIRIDSARSTPRSQYWLEAKRLSPGQPVRDYLGAKGLGCFLRGDYARDETEAGMLGYVQSGELDEWGQKIEQALVEGMEKYCVQDDALFASNPTPHTESIRAYRSGHHRHNVGRNISIVHILMRFH